MKYVVLPCILLFLATFSYAIPPLKDTTKKARVKNLDSIQYGVASYYHSKFQGRPTASGELYDENEFTAAHNSLPFNTWVKVTNLKNKRSIIVKVNDRLHYRNTRVVDLSKKAATELGIIARGLAKVKVEVLKNENPGME